LIVVRRSSNRKQNKSIESYRVSAFQRYRVSKFQSYRGVSEFKGSSEVTSRVMTYQDIYDPANNKDHMRTRFVKYSDDESGYYVHYEPYGRSSREKTDFIDSINEDHEMWASPVKEKGETKVTIKTEGEFLLQDSYKLQGRLWPGQYMSRVFDEVPHKLEMEVIYPYMWKAPIEDSDREENGPYVFGHMLSDYVEKCNRTERTNFFTRGGKGWKWAKNKELMNKLKKIFERENENFINIPNYNLSLCSTTVKTYPRSHFDNILDLFLDFMEGDKEVKFKMNPEAQPFIPGKCFTTPLVRTSPKKIDGVYMVDRPQKPKGNPSKNRPKSSSKDSTSLLCWEMKGETDHKIDDLQKKLDLLIQLSSGPVVHAKNV